MFFKLLKRLIVFSSLMYLVVYGFPFVEEYFTGAKGKITGFAAKNIVAPVAEAIADQAQSIADKAASYDGQSIKSQFFAMQTPAKNPSTSIAGAVASSIGSSGSSSNQNNGNCCACP